MNTDNGLQSVQRIFGRIFIIIDVSFGDNIILFVSADKVDVFFAVVVNGCFETQMIVNGIVELLAEIWSFADEFFQNGGIELKKNRIRNAANRNR